ncbi:MAG: aldehyde dehydrogenase family protein [bacterium]
MTVTESQLYVGGAWRHGASGRGADVRNPATGELCGRVAFADASDVAAAVTSASAAFGYWRNTTPAHRGAMLTRASVLLAARSELGAATLTMEQGKTLAESRAELARAVETLAWHGANAEGICATRRAPAAVMVMPQAIGVVSAFTPWNYPAVIIARKISAALTAGCTIVLKAAEETPAIAAIIVAVLEEAGVPGGVINLVFGEPARISAQLLDAPEVRAFSFTGSTAVGKQLGAHAGRGLKRCVLELGGHAPAIVFADADVSAAASAIAAYKFECAGQSCNAPSRILVHEAVRGQFVERFTEIARAIRVGNGALPDVDMGPMTHERRLTAVEALTHDAIAHGATVVCGGERLDRAGFFWPPTVLVNVGEGAALLTEEPFGPLAPIWSFATFDEAIARANDNPYGLAAYVFTESEGTAMAAARGLDVGSVGVNRLRGVPPDVGIAGLKDSGYGYEGGRAGVEAFLNLKVSDALPE